MSKEYDAALETARTAGRAYDKAVAAYRAGQMNDDEFLAARAAHRAAEAAFDLASAKEQGNWVPANGGTETPFTSRSGKRLLYVWQPSTGNHAYLDLGSDLILTPDESDAALMLY